jgi:ribosomal protein S18 acetylase RimI-like enzyme
MTALHTSTPDMLVTTYLHMTRRDQFVPAYTKLAGVRVEQAAAPSVDAYRLLYRSVGEHLRWRDRLIMPDAELEAALARPGTSVHVLYVEDEAAGYVELTREGRETEIAYFGLFPAYKGMGLGKHLLSYGIERAWQDEIDRVWVHTCNLDDAHALENYIKRGFRVYKVHRCPMPERYQ